MVHHSVCPLCSSQKIELHFPCIDHFVSHQKFDLYRCSDCTFIFTQDYPEEAEIGKFYESQSYISHSDTSKGLTNKLYRLSRSIMLQRKMKLVKKISGLKTGKALDIGSGTGYFVNTMIHAGWKTEGIEINESARNFSLSHFGIEIYPPERMKSLLSSDYDCITLWHVLEHFHEPLNYLSEIFRLLKPGAFCIVALPNSNSFDALHYKTFWAAWDVPRHLWHFSPVTFRHLSEKSGFELLNLKTLPLDVFYISMLSEKYKGLGLSFVKAMFKASFFAFLTFIFSERSSSVIYVLRKPD